MRVARLVMRGARAEMTAALALSALGGLLSSGIVFSLRTTLQNARPTVAGAAVLAALSLLMIGVNVAARRILMRSLHQKVLIRLRHDLVRSATESSLRDVEKLGPALFLGALSMSMQQVMRGAFVLALAARSVAAAVGCTVVLGWMAPSLLPAALLVLAVGIGVAVVLSRRGADAALATQPLAHAFQRDLQGLLEGNRELRQNAMRRKAFFQEAFEPHLRALHGMEARASIWSALPVRWLALPMMALIGAVVFTDLHEYTSSPLFTRSYVLTLLYLQTEVIAALMQLDPVRRADVGLANIEAIQAALSTPEPRGVVPTQAEPLQCSSLELAGVTATYACDKGDRPFVLGPVDLSLKPGEIVFLIGGNGSGKSTLAKVLCGLYPLESGEIRLDGKPVDDKNREAYRQHFTAIFSDHHVFKALYGITGDDVETRARRLLAKMHLGEKVDVKDGEYTTVDLSSGQRKRLAMVTARLEARPIIILDEWASDQDPTLREMFYRKVLPELKKEGKIVLVVSHDDRFFDAADRIVRVQDGKLVELPPSA